VKIPCKHGAKSYQLKSKNHPTVVVILFHPCDLSVVRILVDYGWLLWTARIRNVLEMSSKREDEANEKEGKVQEF